MLLSAVFLFASSSIFNSVLAAPIPLRRHHARAASGGWPQTTSGDSKASFGITGGFKNSYVKEIEGQPTLVGNYPKGSYAGSKDPGIAGFIFEAAGGPDVHIDSAKEAKLSYQVQFPENFKFALAGKLPGLYGGSDPKTAGSCAGGHHNNSCWSARLMWRKEGEGELYAYLPTANQKLAVCKDKCDVQYGASIGNGSWSFKPGEWTQVTERVKLNDVGQMNGEIEILIGGESKVSLKGLQLRGDEAGRIRGAMVCSFFGGSSKPEYQSPQDQQAYFKDFSFEVTEKL
ncbi:polysaccharide lyase family 14 protein [Lyophyllum atratum]|nr:polysaccharide lyase family 14 protein [Lyophyllum atratum]